MSMQFPFHSTASAQAFDQYGVISVELEQQTEMKEKAEALAIEVRFCCQSVTDNTIHGNINLKQLLPKDGKLCTIILIAAVYYSCF